MRFLSILLALPLALAAPILEPRQGADLIPNKWIVVLKSSSSNTVLSQSIASVTSILGGVAPERVFNLGSFKGYSLTATSALLTSITNLGEIAYVEQDSRVYANALTTQANPPYGLARISHRNKGTTEYVYDDSAGAGTSSYIIDTGIYVQHNDFGGRATFLKNFAGDGQDTDCNGHGTHVAGTVGSGTYGVAKKTSLFAVKVLDCSGSGASSGVIDGILYAAAQGKGKKAVANLSLGGVFSQATNDAAAAAVREGLFLAVAAGNSGLPTITSSPASEKSVCTVGASDVNDAKASFSNFGLLVDVFAPGVDVLSTWIDGPDDTNTISGTSMASPHAAGLGAYLLGLEGSRTPTALCDRIVTLATKNKISGLLLTANRLAFNGATA